MNSVNEVGYSPLLLQEYSDIGNTEFIEFLVASELNQVFSLGQ